MRTTDNSGLWAASGAAQATGMLVMVLALALVTFAGIPGVARAESADALDVTQEVSTSGIVPDDLDETFTYELTREDAASPLPAGAEGNSYTFRIEGSATVSLPIVTDGSAVAGALLFDHAGIYAYQLRCTSDASSAAEGMSVDGSVYSIRVSIDNAATGGLRLGWIEIKDQAGTKPSKLDFTQTFKGAEKPAPVPAETPTGWTFFGIRLPSTGDSLWTLMCISAVICVGGVVLVVAGIRKMVKRRRE